MIKYMLSLPILNGRIGKWILALSQFDLKYESAKAVKGQVMANFVVQHCGPELDVVDLVPWTLFFDDSSCGVWSWIWYRHSVRVASGGGLFEFSFPIEASATNN